MSGPLVGVGHIGGLRVRDGLRVHPGFWVALAWLLWREEELFLPLLSACALHEGGHLFAAALLGIPVTGCSLSAVGARLTLPRTCPLRQELTVLLSGCAVNLLCAALLWQSGRTLCSAVHLTLALFNLLPVPPLDGGQVSKLLWETLLPGRSGWVAWRLCAMLACGAVAGFGALYNPAAGIMGIWLAAGLLNSEQ